LIAFGPATEWNPLIAHAEFFSLIDWDPAVPKMLRQSAQAGDWQRTVRLLTKIAHGRPMSFAPNGDEHKQSLWSLHDLECPSRASGLISAWQAFPLKPASRRGTATGVRAIEMNGQRRQALRAGKQPGGPAGELAAAAEQWLLSAAESPAVLPLERLVLFEILRDAASQIRIDLAARLWRAALRISIAHLNGADRPRHDTRSLNDSGSELTRATLQSELMWQAGLLFAPVAGSAALRDRGRAHVWSLLSNSTDAAGVPAAGALPNLPAWMTSLVRARVWGRGFGQPLFSAAQEKRFRAIVDSIAKLCREDGKPGFVGGEANGLVRVWSTAAATFPARLQLTSPAARYLLSLDRGNNGAGTRIARAFRNGKRPNGTVQDDSVQPVFQSDESRLACLRSRWSTTADSVFVAHLGRFPSVELAIGGTALLAGDWEFDLRVDGQSVDTAEWNCVCWHSDDDGDYLELHSQAAETRIERQIFLSRTDGFALLAEAVSADGHSKIEITSRLPLAAGCASLAQTRTRECRLLRDGASARVFPLALNCSRVEGAPGRFGATEGRLTLEQGGVRGIYVPVVFDWNPVRRRSPAAWRRLTVAVGGAAVPSSEAAGFLLEVGRSKWLIYRSLASTLEPRSVLGQHTMYETMLGRFVRGNLEPIIQVEQATRKCE